jgi:hypothetical protein
LDSTRAIAISDFQTATRTFTTFLSLLEDIKNNRTCSLCCLGVTSAHRTGNGISGLQPITTRRPACKPTGCMSCSSSSHLAAHCPWKSPILTASRQFRFHVYCLMPGKVREPITIHSGDSQFSAGGPYCVNDFLRHAVQVLYKVQCDKQSNKSLHPTHKAFLAHIFQYVHPDCSLRRLDKRVLSHCNSITKS